MKKITGFILLSGIILTLASCGNTADSTNDTVDGDFATIIHADYPLYDTAQSLINSADLVFSGTVENITYEELDIRMDNESNSSTGLSSSEMFPYTIYEIRVTRIYKGETQADTISIKVLGGEIAGNKFITVDAPSISQGETYLFLTKTYENTYPSLLNLTQAAYDLNTPEAYNAETNTITLSQILEILE